MILSSMALVIDKYCGSGDALTREDNIEKLRVILVHATRQPVLKPKKALLKVRRFPPTTRRRLKFHVESCELLNASFARPPSFHRYFMTQHSSQYACASRRLTQTLILGARKGLHGGTWYAGIVETSTAASEPSLSTFVVLRPICNGSLDTLGLLGSGTPVGSSHIPAVLFLPLRAVGDAWVFTLPRVKIVLSRCHRPCA